MGLVGFEVEVEVRLGNEGEGRKGRDGFSSRNVDSKRAVPSFVFPLLGEETHKCECEWLGVVVGLMFGSGV